MSNSRVEEILTSKITGNAYTKKPLSRVEELLLNLDSGSGGGGGGSGSYPGSGDPENGYSGNISSSQDFDDVDVADIFSVLSTEND